MARNPIRISVSRKDKHALNELLSAGVQSVRVALRALALLHLSDGSTAPDIARALKKLTAKAVRTILQRHDLKPWREKTVVRGRSDRRVLGKHGGGARNL
jgi:hypothetical protein